MLCSVVSDSFATPWTVAHQAPLSMEFSRQEYWSGCFSYEVDKVGYALGHDDEEWSSFIIYKVRKCLLHGIRGKKIMR